jgi:hypothetical protein
MSKTAEVLERLAALEAAIAGIGHNAGPPLDDEPPPPPKHKPVLIPDREVAKRYHVVVRTLERWDLQPDLGFPLPVRINRRRYRELAALEAWDRRAVAQALPRARAGRFSKPRNVEVR